MWQRWRLQALRRKVHTFVAKEEISTSKIEAHVPTPTYESQVPWAFLEQYLHMLRRNTHPLQQPREEAQMGEGRLGSKFNIISLPKPLPRSTLGELTLEELSPQGSRTHSWLSTYLGLLCWSSIYSFLKIFFRSLPFAFFDSSHGVQAICRFGEQNKWTWKKSIYFLWMTQF